MSIEQRKVVDAIGTEKLSGVIILTIADTLDWSDVRSHLLTLQSKINDYLDFIESGEIYRTYPSASGQKIKIDLVFRYPPPEGEVFQFLSKAISVIEDAGYLMSHKTIAGTA
jgi:hypothetical protein